MNIALSGDGFIRQGIPQTPNALDVFMLIKISLLSDDDRPHRLYEIVSNPELDETTET